MTSPFCIRPFYELSLQHNGDIFPCCQLHQEVLGNIQNDTIEEVWNSEKLVSLRREFLEGNIKTCKDNINHLGCHLWYRHLEERIDKTAIQKSAPKKLDIRLNGKCNLRCIMCAVWKGPNHVYDQTSFWTDGPQKIFPFLEEIDLLGGEPLIQKDTYRLIDEVSSVNTHCKWNITTNAHWKFNETIQNYFDKIKINHLIISIDSIFPDTFAKIRRDGHLPTLLNCLKSIEDYQKSSGNIARIRLDFLIQKLNYQELIQFMEFCRIKKYHFGLQIMRHPASQTIYQEDSLVLEKWHKELCLYFQAHPENYQLDELLVVLGNVLVK